MQTPNKQQLKNLEKLATYIEALPGDYDHFSMTNYAVNRQNPEYAYVREFPDYARKAQTALAACGTVACAVGHGPAAGIIPAGNLKDFDWETYAETAFGTKTDSDTWTWLFSAAWSRVDNSAQGAAARIRYFLQNKKMPDGDAARNLNPASYAAFLN